MNKSCRLKKYLVVVSFYFELYDYTFDVWAYSKIEARHLVLNYYKPCNVYDNVYIDVISRPFTTIIARLKKKVPDAPTCERI